MFQHLLVLSALTALHLLAQNDWQSLQQLQPGQKITVYQQKASDSGRFARVTDNSLVYTSGKGEVAVARADVKKVTVPGGKRLRNAAIGAGIGFAVGAILAGTAGTRFFNEGQDIRAALVVIPGVSGAGLGALIPGSRTVYRAPRK